MNRSFVWGSFIAVGFVTFVLTLSVRQGVAIGLFAALCVWFSLSQVTARWRDGLSPLIWAAGPEDAAEQLRLLLR